MPLGERKPPRGPIAWARRNPLTWCARLAALVGLALAGAWLTGRILNDTRGWSQYLFWIPTVLVVAGAWAMLLVSWVLQWVSARLGGVALRPLLLVACLGLTGWMLAAEWRVYRYVLPPRTPDGPTVTVLNWNLSSVWRFGRGAAVIEGESPDLVVVINARRDEFRQPLFEAMRALGDGEEGEGVRFLQRYPVAIGGRMPILRQGTTRPDLVEGGTDGWRSGHDPGLVMFVELDPSGVLDGLDGPLVVWLVDLPSDPRLERREIARAAREAIDRWDGPGLVPDGLGRWVPERREGPARFPEPDLVIGDFNMPRGSASLDVLLEGFGGGLREAFAAAGRGHEATWPKGRALWHLDMAFVGERLRAAGYRTGSGGGRATHRYQVVEVGAR